MEINYCEYALLVVFMPYIYSAGVGRQGFVLHVAARARCMVILFDERFWCFADLFQCFEMNTSVFGGPPFGSRRCSDP